MDARVAVLVFWAISLFFGASALSKGPDRCESFFTSDSLDSKTIQTKNYLQSTLNSLETMRGENGLLVDTIEVRTLNGKTHLARVINVNTSPTNIAIDLLVQGELHSTSNISRVISTLKSLEYHKDTGLFFSRYAADSTSRVADYDVSSVDNFHLALALWTIKENFSDSQIGIDARELFNRMDFSVYLDETSGLIGGNLKYQNGTWIKEEYNYSNLGSEARSLYSAGWALGLFKNKDMNELHVKKGLASTQAEVFQSPEGAILKLWDGAAFQLFFPKIFIGEENYSPLLKGMFKNAGQYMVADGFRKGLSFPAAHSPVRTSVEGTGRATYQDKTGNMDLVSSQNRDVVDPHFNKYWDKVFAPYALFMAATSDISLISNFTKIEKIKTGENPLYSEQMGWMDSLDVFQNKDGLVVNAQESLNQGMIALSLLQIQSKDQMSLSARTLFKNPMISRKLNFYYQNFDLKLEQLNNSLF